MNSENQYWFINEKSMELHKYEIYKSVRLVRFRWLTEKEARSVFDTFSSYRDQLKHIPRDGDMYAALIDVEKNKVRQNSKVQSFVVEEFYGGSVLYSERQLVQKIFLQRLRSLCDIPIGLDSKLDLVQRLATEVRECLYNKPLYSFPDIQVLTDACIDADLYNDVQLLKVSHLLFEVADHSRLGILGMKRENRRYMYET